MTRARPDQTAIWLFDGVCMLCSNAVRYTLRHEIAPTIRFVAIQSVEGMALAKLHGIDPANPDSFLFIENGLALSKSDGVIALTRHLRGITRFVKIGKFIPRFLRDWLYDCIARNRYLIFGKSQTCLMPDLANSSRFVLPACFGGAKIDGRLE